MSKVWHPPREKREKNMLRVIAWAALVAASIMFGGSASFAQEPPRWGTDAKLLSNTGCNDVGAIDNFPALSTYRPKIGGGEENSALSFTFGRGATIIQTTSSSSQLHGKGKYKGVTITGNVTYREGQGSYEFEIEPASVTANTKNVKIKGTITNFVGRSGCTVEISGTYKKL